MKQRTTALHQKHVFVFKLKVHKRFKHSMRQSGESMKEADCHHFPVWQWFYVGGSFAKKWVDSETTYVILHGLFGGVELLVVGAATWLMN